MENYFKNKLFLTTTFFSGLLFIIITLCIILFFDDKIYHSEADIFIFLSWFVQIILSSIAIGIINIKYYKLLESSKNNISKLLKSTSIIIFLGICFPLSEYCLSLLVNLISIKSNIQFMNIIIYDLNNPVLLSLFILLIIPFLGSFLIVIFVTLYIKVSYHKVKLQSDQEVLKIINRKDNI